MERPHVRRRVCTCPGCSHQPEHCEGVGLQDHEQLRGDAGVEWIDTNYFKTKERSDKEVQAAVLALTVHGNDGVKINRDRVVKSYADYIKANPERAGFVASDLGNWGRWEFVNDYMALLRSGTQQAFASRYSIVLYLMRSPSQEARNALEQLRAEGIL